MLSKLEIPYEWITLSIEGRGYFECVEFLIRKGAHVLTLEKVIASFIMLNNYGLAFLITLFIATQNEFRQSLTVVRPSAMQEGSGAILVLIILFQAI